LKATFFSPCCLQHHSHPRFPTVQPGSAPGAAGSVRWPRFNQFSELPGCTLSSPRSGQPEALGSRFQPARPPRRRGQGWALRGLSACGSARQWRSRSRRSTPARPAPTGNCLPEANGCWPTLVIEDWSLDASPPRRGAAALTIGICRFSSLAPTATEDVAVPAERYAWEFQPAFCWA